MANSIELLKTVNLAINERNFIIGNIDITVIAESPRLAPYIEQMRSVVANALETEISNVSVKATTEEGMGFTGDGTGISASAIVLLKRRESNGRS